MPSSTSFSNVSVSILEKLLYDVVRNGNDSSQKDHFDIQFYTKWSRVLIQTYLELNMFEKLSAFLDQFETLLAHSSLPLVPSNDSFQNDLLWTCIAVWNVSTDLWSVNDFEGAKHWMQIALSFASYCEQDCPQIKAMRDSYSEFLGDVIGVEK
jgi:hypothetical protein